MTLARAKPAADPALFDRYVGTPPSAQNAVDAVPGWRTALPGVAAGDLGLTDDPRIAWAVDGVGGVEGCHVLELGPLDGGHTAMLHRAGAARIDAVEANRLAYLRCLVAKELLGLDRARFHLGDFTAGFGPLAQRFDLVVASGVLYHLSDPVGLIAALAQMTDRLYLWTHVMDAAAMPAGDPRRAAFSGRIDTRTAAGVSLRLHRRGYLGSERDVEFCGGPRDAHAWMERDGLLALLAALGFDALAVGHDTPEAAGGPALSVLACRTGTRA